MKTIGSRRMVFSGGAKKTAGLTKSELIKVKKGTRLNKDGKRVPVYSIVSKKEERSRQKKNMWADSIRLARARLQKKQKKPPWVHKDRKRWSTLQRSYENIYQKKKKKQAK